MTTEQFRQARLLAGNDTAMGSFRDLGIFDGFALPGFGPVYVTLDNVAKLIQWQCMCFDGSLDLDALQVIANFGKRRFIII